MALHATQEPDWGGNGEEQRTRFAAGPNHTHQHYTPKQASYKELAQNDYTDAVPKATRPSPVANPPPPWNRAALDCRVRSIRCCAA